MKESLIYQFSFLGIMFIDPVYFDKLVFSWTYMSCEENPGVELLTDLCKWIASAGKI